MSIQTNDQDQTLVDVLKTIDSRLEGLEKNRVSLSLSLVCAMICLVVAVFAVSYAINSASQLTDQIDNNQRSICSQAKSAAAGYNQKLPDETRTDFLLRIEGQRDVLIAAGDLDCQTLSGRLPFDVIRARALTEIDRILFPPAGPEDINQPS